MSRISFYSKALSVPEPIIEFFFYTFDLYEVRRKIGYYHGISFEVRTKEENHFRPHVHAGYGDYSISISLDTFEVLAGNLPSKQTKKALEWVQDNSELCTEEWNSIHLDRLLSFTDTNLAERR